MLFLVFQPFEVSNCNNTCFLSRSFRGRNKMALCLYLMVTERRIQLNAHLNHQHYPEAPRSRGLSCLNDNISVRMSNYRPEKSTEHPNDFMVA